MEITVIVPWYNEHERWPAVWEALRPQLSPQTQVLIIDDGSNPPFPRTYLKDPHITLVTLNNGGAGRARNVAVIEAENEYLAFLDADCVPDRHWLALGSSYLHYQTLKTPYAIVAGNFHKDFLHTRPSIPAQYNLLYESPISLAWGIYGFGNVFTTKSTYRKIGGCPSTKWGHDKHFFQRARTLNIPIHFKPNLIVSHPAVSGREKLTRLRQHKPPQTLLEILINLRAIPIFTMKILSDRRTPLHKKPLFLSWFLILRSYRLFNLITQGVSKCFTKQSPKPEPR